MEGSFFFITSEVEFQESTKKGARVSATFMELNTPSQNKRIYRIEEGAKIAKSLIGRFIRFGADWFGKHLEKVPKIGIVESAFQEGNKIKGIVRIWDKGIIAKLKKGVKFLFSVGGVAKFAEVVRRGANKFIKLYQAVCTHLQLLPNDPTGAGFPTAKMHKILEINESVVIARPETQFVCDKYGCAILDAIEDEYAFEEAKKKAVRDSIKRKAINKAIAHSIVAVIKEVRQFIETQNED